jgi:type VI secretion system protein ImpF
MRRRDEPVSHIPMLLDKLREAVPPIDPGSWRRIVLRDIERLLGDGARGATLPVAHLPHAASSVLNHGLPPFAALEDGMLDAHRWATHLRDVLAAFEPRLDPRTIRVAPVLCASDRQMLALLYDIDGVLLSRSERIPLTFRIALDFSCGAIRIVDE